MVNVLNFACICRNHVMYYYFYINDSLLLWPNLHVTKWFIVKTFFRKTKKLWFYDINIGLGLESYRFGYMPSKITKFHFFGIPSQYKDCVDCNVCYVGHTLRQLPTRVKKANKDWHNYCKLCIFIKTWKTASTAVLMTAFLF